MNIETFNRLFPIGSKVTMDSGREYEVSGSASQFAGSEMFWAKGIRGPISIERVKTPNIISKSHFLTSVFMLEKSRFSLDEILSQFLAYERDQVTALLPQMVKEGFLLDCTNNDYAISFAKLEEILDTSPLLRG